jgi:hypothetical protein
VPPGRLDANSVDPDVVALDVGLRPELADGLAVAGDTPVEHELLGTAARGEACPREDLLEALFHGEDLISRLGAPMANEADGL